MNPVKIDNENRTARLEPHGMTGLRQKDVLSMSELSAEDIALILATAESFKEIISRPIKKVPTLRGKSVVNLFYEPSTRTRTSFELAGKFLSADTTSIVANTSSIVKGESLKDTIKTLEALGTDVLILRHPNSGAAHFAARNTKIPVINAGDGFHEHPTQALVDLFTIRERLGSIKGLSVLIVGDIAFSRVARSNVYGLTRMGAKVTLCGPSTLLPCGVRRFPAAVTTDFDEALVHHDVIIMLRIQMERQKENYFPSLREYTRYFGLTRERVARAKENVLIMHPGPINRGIEIMPDVAEGLHSAIEEQVTNGIAVRMALLYLLSVRDERREEHMAVV